MFALSPNLKTHFATGLIALLCFSAALWNLYPRESAGSNPFAKTKSEHYLDTVELDNGTKLKLGLSIREPGLYYGYTLISPLTSDKTWLIDMGGRIVHQWQHDSHPSLGAQLLENGHLLRCAQIKSDDHAGDLDNEGKIQEFDWNGELVWNCVIPDKNIFQHHDCIKLPNGNVMVTAKEKKPVAEANAAGWKGLFPEKTPYFSGDCILEIKPTGKTSGEIVWRWSVMDHILQDIDPAKPNYVKPENVADHPELVDLNYQAPIHKTPEQLQRQMEFLKSIGYLGAGHPTSSTSATPHNPDWTHFNSVDYNAHLDQVMISVRQFCEIWIIDHSTTTAQAAGHVGGRCGKGGDLLYRWGNPAAYRCGKPEDQILFFQHNAHWIPDGLPGAGRLLTFNNGDNRPAGAFSSIEEVVLPSDGAGHYPNSPRSSFGPTKPIWSYAAERKDDFFSEQVSGVQRLPNGNTLICSGMHGVIFEVAHDGQIVWRFVNPIGDAPVDENGSKERTDAGRKFERGGKIVSTPNGFEVTLLRNSLFRATRYSIEFPAFAGKKLKPGIRLQDWYIEDSRSENDVAKKPERH